MNNTYHSTYSCIEDALDHISNFEDIADKFKEKYSDYNYKVKLEKKNEQWNVEINITNEKEPINSRKVTQRRSSHGVL